MNVKLFRAALSAALLCAASLTHAPSACGQNPPKKSSAAADLYGDPLPGGAIARYEVPLLVELAVVRQVDFWNNPQ